MEDTNHRHDITDEVWARLEKALPGGTGNRGRPSDNNRRFINAVKWHIRTGAPWRDLPPSYGNWNTVYKRYREWAKNGTWERLSALFTEDSDLEWLMIDATHIKVHPHAAGAIGGNQGMARTKGGLTPK
jgi:transposase